jgi:hypothetical protein
MTTKPNLALLSAITGIIGLVLAIYGGLYLFAPTFQNTPVSQNLQTPVGFAFATTAPLVQDETLFNLYYNSIDMYPMSRNHFTVSLLFLAVT